VGMKRRRAILVVGLIALSVVVAALLFVRFGPRWFRDMTEAVRIKGASVIAGAYLHFDSSNQYARMEKAGGFKYSLGPEEYLCVLKDPGGESLQVMRSWDSKTPHGGRPPVFIVTGKRAAEIWRDGLSPSLRTELRETSVGIEQTGGWSLPYNVIRLSDP
jgi:hypothetical protein